MAKAAPIWLRLLLGALLLPLIWVGLALLLPSALSSAAVDFVDDHVRAELRAALGGSLLVLPVLVGGARMPRPEQLPEDIKAIATLNAVPLRHESFDDDTENIVATVLGVAAKTRRWEDRGAWKAKIAYALGGAAAACMFVLVAALIHFWILSRPLSASIGAPLTTLLLISGMASGAWLGLSFEARKRKLR
ncbi:hypothetical protein [Methyloceanibacter sp.]|uniref:hypothetical protein n=1 Tax=Methyloceanibacter sp. TaxID=1965321 RepID=UPI003564EE75